MAVAAASDVDRLLGFGLGGEGFELSPGTGRETVFTFRKIDFEEYAVALGIGVVQVHEDEQQGDEQFDGVVVFHRCFFWC